MTQLVQKFIVHEAADASPLLPQHVALVDSTGVDVVFSGSAASNATTSKAGVVKKASSVAALADGAELSDVVTTVNAILANMKSAGQMA